MNQTRIFSDETENFRVPAQPAPGEAFTIRLRVRDRRGASVFLHFVRDGVSTRREMQQVGEEGMYVLFEATVEGVQERGEYAFEILCDGEILHYGRSGLEDPWHVRPFVVIPDCHVPDWARGALWYQIFVDRFCNGDPSNDVQDGEIRDELGNLSHHATWSEKVTPNDVNRFYGGDLQGVIDKLDYLKSLGVEVLYLNPVFVSPSNHKYNTQDYNHVDPHYGKILLDGSGKEKPVGGAEANAVRNGAVAQMSGGAPRDYAALSNDTASLEASDQVLCELIEKAHSRGMRVVLDGVFNHCGAFNKWMNRNGIYEENGQKVGAWWDEKSPYREFFRFEEDGAYESWWNNESLPKLNVDGCETLKEELLDLARKWISPPYNADGWRLDVAADLGHSQEANHAFWKEFHAAVKAVNPDAVILAEHYGNPRWWLNGREWDSVMNYDAFMEPVSYFLTGMEKHSDSYDPMLEGNAEVFVRRMLRTMSHLPQPALECALNQLDNHDHSRFLTRTNHRAGRLGQFRSEDAEEGVDEAIMRLGILMQMTWPGAPGLYYGDEVGLCGFTDPDNRRPFPWERMDSPLYDFTLYATRLRKSYPALRTGSLLILKAAAGVLIYGRLLHKEAVLIVLSQGTSSCHVEINTAEITGVAPAAVTRVFATDAHGYNVGRVTKATDNGFLPLHLPPRSCSVWVWET